MAAKSLNPVAFSGIELCYFITKAAQVHILECCNTPNGLPQVRYVIKSTNIRLAELWTVHREQGRANCVPLGIPGEGLGVGTHLKISTAPMLTNKLLYLYDMQTICKKGPLTALGFGE
jgi:hypothetical protein